MSDGQGGGLLAEQPRRKRGRPLGSRKKSQVELHVEQQRYQMLREGWTGSGEPMVQQTNHMIPSALMSEEEREERLAYDLAEEHLTPFSRMLRKLVRRERAEIIRVAKELEVSENTVYRWMNGNSEPRAPHLRRLLEVFPGQQESLRYAITLTFGKFPQASTPVLHEVRKEVYRRVLEMGASVSDEDNRTWQICQVLFAQALEHLDAERRGVAITLAKLMPPWEDGVHSLREVLTHGTAPWSAVLESRLYLGSTSLAGMAVALQRLQLWDDAESSHRTQVEIDRFEHSACAVPIMRGNLIGGALIVSSMQPYFFRDSLASQVVQEYALLIGVALADRDFYPHKRLCLRPMPELAWQRERIAQVYNQSILAYARGGGLSYREAELRVQRELERSFEEQAGVERSQTHDHVPAYDT